MRWQLWVAASVMIWWGCSASAHVGGEVGVDFLWVRPGRDGKSMEGGMSHAVVKVEPSDSGIQVGVFEANPGGTGEGWRAAMWVAALTGTLSMQENPLDYRYSVETDSLAARVDGPSAGGLFAVAVMASLSGHKLDPAATMTGTINPDGTIGPVGGVAAKLEAAGKHGKKRVCYPSGQRYEEEETTGHTRDMMEVGARFGVKAVEVGDLNAAYECLVGRQLERVKPVRKSLMALTPQAYDLLSGKTMEWLERSKKAYFASRRLGEDLRFERMWKENRTQMKDATALLERGLVAAAYWKAVRAYVDSRAILLSGMTIKKLAEGSPTDAFDVFSIVDRESKESVETVFEKLAQVLPSSIGQVIALLDAYEAAISAVVNRQFASIQYSALLARMKDALKAGKGVDELVGLFAELHRPLSELTLAEVNSQIALDNIALVGWERGKKGEVLARVDEVTRLFQGAASANIEYFDTIFVREVSQRGNKSIEEVSALLFDKEPNYRRAQFNLKLPASGRMGYASSGTAASMAQLAGALSSFFASSALMARFFSIGVKFDEGGKMKGVERETALEESLMLAEVKARENAALALKHTGAIPETARIAYQIGLVLAESGQHDDRFNALEQFWRSSVWSQVAVYLQRAENRGVVFSPARYGGAPGVLRRGP